MGIVGGTASALGGGKFSNGAMSGAFTHMFNAEGGGVMNGIAKGTRDLIDGVMSIPKALISYGRHLSRVTGFRDWQNDNVVPWNQLEANLEYEGFVYGLKNHKVDIARGIGNDMLNRPNYYIGGFMAGAGLGYVNSAAGGLYTAGSVSVKPAAAASDYIHTKINPFH